MVHNSEHTRCYIKKDFLFCGFSLGKQRSGSPRWRKARGKHLAVMRRRRRRRRSGIGVVFGVVGGGGAVAVAAARWR